MFLAGAVYTLDATRPWAPAVAVRAAGRMVLPGFVEGHIHPLLGGFHTSGVDLQVPTAADAPAAIAAYAELTQGDPFAC